MAKYNQLTPLPFKGLKARAISTLLIALAVMCWASSHALVMIVCCVYLFVTVTWRVWVVRSAAVFQWLHFADSPSMATFIGVVRLVSWVRLHYFLTAANVAWLSSTVLFCFPSAVTFCVTSLMAAARQCRYCCNNQ